ncbi:pre-mRNA-splicing factor 38A-like [Gasterosteus aculeatus]
MELKYVGGVFGGNIKPTPFLCLTLKMLQIQPEKDIIVEFIKNEDFKYVRLLGAMYMRLTGTAVDCYKYLEPLYNDYRKVKNQNRNGEFELMHVDEFIDELLHAERMCDIILPRLQKRHVLGGADLQRDEARHPEESATAARAPAATAAGPETDATAPNLQVTTEATDIAATQSPPRGVQKRVTRRVEEETIDLFPPFYFACDLLVNLPLNLLKFNDVFKFVLFFK